MEFNPQWRDEVAVAMSGHYQAKTKGCWPATCYRHPSGHPMVRVPVKYRAEGQPRRPQYLARIMYELYVGEIPEGSVVHHRCENPGCANPNHLEIIGGTSAHRRTHTDVGCKYGHPWTAANTYIETIRDRGGVRQRRRCRICLAAKARRFRQGRKRDA